MGAIRFITGAAHDYLEDVGSGTHRARANLVQLVDAHNRSSKGSGGTYEVVIAHEKNLVETLDPRGERERRIKVSAGAHISEAVLVVLVSDDFRAPEEGYRLEGKPTWKVGPQLLIEHFEEFRAYLEGTPVEDWRPSGWVELPVNLVTLYLLALTVSKLAERKQAPEEARLILESDVVRDEQLVKKAAEECESRGWGHLSVNELGLETAKSLTTEARGLLRRGGLLK